MFRLKLLLAVFLFAVSTVRADVAQQSGACSGFSVRLAIGEQARVIPNTSANNLRSDADSSASRVGQIPTGGQFSVLDGPRCVDGVTWWYVNYNGTRGWTGEGQRGEYWLEPMTSPGQAGSESSIVVPSGGGAGSASGSGSGLNAARPVRRQLPPNTLIGGAEGVGGGPTGIPYYLLTLECDVALGESSIVAVSSVPNPRPNMFDAQEVPNGGTGLLMTTICFHGAVPAQIGAISPSGQSVAPVVRSDFGTTFVGLPLSAFMEPGQWQLYVGNYTVRVDTRPAKPMAVTGDDGQIWFGGLRPNERALVMTTDTNILELQMDLRGYFIGQIEMTEFDSFHTAAGEYAGTLFNLAPDWQPDPNADMFNDSGIEMPIGDVLAATFWHQGYRPSVTCPGSVASRLTYGGSAYVVPGLGDNLLKSKASFADEAIGRIPGNGVVRVIYGPVCESSYGIAWWVVNYNGKMGWTGEGQGGTYWLAPS